MSLYNYDNVKEQEIIIEEKRLTIRDIKKHITKKRNLIDTISNLYEYLAIPLCTISLTLIALFEGIIIYILPLFTSIIAINVIVYKFLINSKIEKLKNELVMIKEERKVAYDTREHLIEDIFNDLNDKELDTKDYYHKLVEISKKSNLLTSYMKPYKETRKKLIKIKHIINYLFDYLLAPVAAIVLPLACAFIKVNIILKVILMTVSSILLLSCVLIDERLSKKIEELSDEIDIIKSDRTVNYVKRDIMLNEALEYLKTIETSIAL